MLERVHTSLRQARESQERRQSKTIRRVKELIYIYRYNINSDIISPQILKFTPSGVEISDIWTLAAQSGS